MNFLRSVSELLHDVDWDGDIIIENGIRAAGALIISNAERLFFVGNGGSAAIGSHMAIDWTMHTDIPALCFTDPAALTAVSNDHGFDYVFAKQIERHCREDDVLLAISSSGRSPDILNAVAFASEKGMKIVTFSGFDKDNPLREDGDINFYVPSHDYGPVECCHLILNHAILNYVVGMQKSS